MVDLEEVAVALDAYQDWDENMRAEVYHAIDVAPTEPIDRFDWLESQKYFSSGAYLSWKRIREYVVAYTGTQSWAVDLLEAAGGESAPTKEEILKALYRGARMIR